MTVRIEGVEDHGVWRGHRSWTVHVDGPRGRAQVSARDVTTEAEAIAQARETYANARRFSEAEKVAVRRQQEALARGLGL